MLLIVGLLMAQGSHRPQIDRANVQIYIGKDIITIYVPKGGETKFDDHGWHYRAKGYEFIFDEPIIFKQRAGWPPADWIRKP